MNNNTKRLLYCPEVYYDFQKATQSLVEKLYVFGEIMHQESYPGKRDDLVNSIKLLHKDLLFIGKYDLIFCGDSGANPLFNGLDSINDSQEAFWTGFRSAHEFFHPEKTDYKIFNDDYCGELYRFSREVENVIQRYGRTANSRYVYDYIHIRVKTHILRIVQSMIDTDFI